MKTSQIKDILNQKRDESLAEEVINFEMINQLIEGQIVDSKDGKYEFSSYVPHHRKGEAEDIIHIKANKGKLNDLKIPHPHKIDGEYGEGRIVKVKNKETGATTEHSVYQSGYYKDSNKPGMSVRTWGKPSEHSKEHAEALVAHLGKKHVYSY